MADLVGEDVGLREVAGRLKALLKLVEEAQVDIDLLVQGAVERPGRGAGEPAAGLNLAAEDDHLRPLVGPARGLELLRPEILGVALDELDELVFLVVVRAPGDGVVAGARLRDLWERAGWVGDVEAAAASTLEEEEVDDDQHDDRDDPS